MDDPKVSIPIKLKHSMWRRISLLQAALEEKMGKKMTRDELIEHIINDFLNSN